MEPPSGVEARLVGGDLADLGAVAAGGVVAQVEPDVDERPGGGGRDDVLPHAQDLGVVVLHRAAHGEQVVRGRRTHPRDLVGGDGGSHAGAADENTAVGPPLGDRSGDPEGDLRVGDLRRGQVEDVAHAPVLGQSFRKSVLQEGSIARGTDGDSHAPSLSGLAAQGEPSDAPNDSRTPAITVKGPDSSRKHDARCSHQECLQRPRMGSRYRGPAR